jgi:glyoxylase-like metal-dependent hydrolase (beta-lactamase superfamily II)
MKPLIHTIDLEYLGTPGAIASYIIEAPDGPVMIETGPGSCLDALVAGLDDLGLKPADVKHTFVTHIHFDHAGACGWMAQQGSHVYVHEVGAPHLIDPSKLNASAKRIYGDDMDRLWGELIPIPAQQLTALKDGDVINAAGVDITAIDTPGHAWHHMTYALDTDAGRIGFTGDAAATHIEGVGPRFISVPTPPPEFDLQRWLDTVDRIAGQRFAAIYPTHFGRMDNVEAHLFAVKEALEAHATFVREKLDAGMDAEAILPVYRAWFIEQARQAGVPAEKLGFYVKDTLADMNLTGMVRYWTKRAERAAT